MNEELIQKIKEDPSKYIKTLEETKKKLDLEIGISLNELENLKKTVIENNTFTDLTPILDKLNPNSTKEELEEISQVLEKMEVQITDEISKSLDSNEYLTNLLKGI